MTTDRTLDRDALAELIAEHLSGTYHCTRVWSAWGVGTMTQDDFEPVDESDTPGEIADAIIAKLNADRTQSAQAVAEPHPPTRHCMCADCLPSFDDTEALPTPKAEPEPVWDGKLHESLQRSLNALRLECPPELVNDCEFEVRKSFEALSTSLTTAKRMYGAARDRLEAIDASQPDPFAERVAQPAVEPVAWRLKDKERSLELGFDVYVYYGKSDFKPGIDPCELVDGLKRLYTAPTPNALDAERWQFIRRRLCLTGNGDGTCAMHAINLPACLFGWPEPGQVAEFCDSAIDRAIAAQSAQGGV